MVCFFLERLKYVRITCRKPFLHTNFHRAKNQMRTVCAQWICLIYNSAKREFIGYFAVLFFFLYVNLFVRYGCFIGLVQSSGITTILLWFNNMSHINSTYQHRLHSGRRLEHWPYDREGRNRPGENTPLGYRQPAKRY